MRYNELQAEKRF